MAVVAAAVSTVAPSVAVAASAVGRWAAASAVGTAAVRSTDWFLNANATEMRVGVLRGSVVMTSSATAHGVLIPARYGARLEQGLDPVQARPWSPAEFAEFISRTDVR